MNENLIKEDQEIFVYDLTSKITKERQIYNFIWNKRFVNKSMKDFEYQLVLEVIEQFENLSNAMAFDIISVYPGDTIKEFPNHKLICEILGTKDIQSIDYRYIKTWNHSKIYFYSNNKELFIRSLFINALNIFSLSSIQEKFNIVLDTHTIKNFVKEKKPLLFDSQTYFTLYDYKIRLDKECIILLCGLVNDLNKIINYHHEIEPFTLTELYKITKISNGVNNVFHSGLSNLVNIKEYFLFFKVNRLQFHYLIPNRRQKIEYNKIYDYLDDKHLDNLMSIYPTSDLILFIFYEYTNNENFKYRMEHFIKYLNLNKEGNEEVVYVINNIVKETNVIRLKERDYTEEEKQIAEKANLKKNFKKVTPYILARIGEMKEKLNIIEIFVNNGVKPSTTLLINMLCCSCFKTKILDCLIKILKNIENKLDINPN